MKKIFRKIFKIKPKDSFFSFPIDLTKFEYVIFLWDGEKSKVEAILRRNKFKLKKCIILDEKEENINEFLKYAERRSFVVDLREKDKNMFLRYLSSGYPVIGYRKDLNFVLPADNYRTFLKLFMKMIHNNRDEK